MPQMATPIMDAVLPHLVLTHPTVDFVRDLLATYVGERDANGTEGNPQHPLPA